MLIMINCVIKGYNIQLTCSIKKQKLEVASVGQSEEFGVITEPQLDFAIGDVIVSVRNGK